MKKLNTVSIGLHNLSRQGLRTAVMVAFCFILAASLMVSGVLRASMERSVDQTVARMGADVIAVPEEYAADYTDALFTGSHCAFYFDRAWYGQVAAVKGVAQATPQLYIASLAAACCSIPVQLIAFEPETDFIVSPWLEQMELDSLGAFEVLVGSDITGDIGDTITFFNIDLTVAGRMEPTGTGYDSCAFINFDTAYAMLETEQLRSISTGDAEPDSVISSIMVRVEEGADADKVARAISFGIENCPLRAYTANGIVSSVSDSVESFSAFSTVLNYLLLVMAVLAILCIFTITIWQRKYEFGLLITLGATKGKLVAVILTEGLVIGLLGGVLGVAVSGGVMLAFQEVILIRLGIPSFVTEPAFYLLTALKSVGISLAAGLVSSVCAIVMIDRSEPLRLIQEGNA